MRADVRLRAHAGAVGDGRATTGRRPRPPTATPSLRLISDLRIGIEGNRARARHTLSEGERALRRARLAPRPRRARALRRRQGAPADDVPLLARLAGRRPVPGPSLAPAPPALGADAQGPDLRADRRHGRGRDHLAARDAAAASATGTTATAGCATPRSRCGALHALGLDWEADDFMQFVADLERDERRRAADHVRARRRARPARAGARPPDAATRARRRSGSATAPTASTRTTCSAPCSTRSTCTRRWAATSRSGCGR